VHKEKGSEVKSGEITAVAMSGGVDSAAAAGLLLEQGRRLMGVTARMSGPDSRCCSDEDIERAQRLAEQLGIPHHVVDLRSLFEERIIADFVSEYISGRTPSPCARCNAMIKFGALMEEAARLGASRMATGHYARVRRDDEGRFHLLCGKDAKKDQSYFLFALRQQQLARTDFPLGDMDKQEVRSFAARKDLASRESKESQELCFITDCDHGTWIDVRSPETADAGEMVAPDGTVLGKHLGLHHYTVGQRRGLGLALGRPVYVVRLDAERNEVVVGDREDAMSGGMRVTGLNWIAAEKPPPEMRVMACIRYNHGGGAADVRVGDGGVADVVFDEPQFAVAPGQVAAFYDGEELLGGGWIDCAVGADPSLTEAGIVGGS